MPNSTRSTRLSRWGPNLGLIALGVALAGTVIFYTTRHFGRIEGQEFSPQTFKRRHFSYHEIPLVGLQVSPVTRGDRTGELGVFLAKQQMLPPAEKQKRWDLIVAKRGSVVSRFGNARILCNYLDSNNGQRKELVWLQWSKNHPELAKVLWAAVAKAARQDLYTIVPELMTLARQTSRAEELEQTLARTLAKRYLDLAQNLQSLGNHDQAVELYTEALSTVPDEIDALRGRAKSFASLGKKKEAAADRAQVRNLEDRSPSENSTSRTAP